MNWGLTVCMRPYEAPFLTIVNVARAVAGSFVVGLRVL